MKNDLGYRKGQYFSFDAIVASVIFVLTLIMLLSYWHSVRTFLDFQAADMNKEATRMSNLLFTPPDGDCNAGTLKRLGFANSWTDKKMNYTLLYCVDKMKEDALKANLSSPYNVSIVINDPLGKEYLLGDDPDNFDPTLQEVTKIRRIGTIADVPGANGPEDHMATVDLYLYR